MNTKTDTKHDPSIAVGLFSAGMFGTVLAALQGLRIHKMDVSFEFSLWTVIAFLIGFDCLFAYWRFISAGRDRTPRRMLCGGLVVLILIVLVALFRAWWPGRIEKAVQELAGLEVALCFVGAGLAMVYRIVFAMEREDESQGQRGTDVTG